MPATDREAKTPKKAWAKGPEDALVNKVPARWAEALEPAAKRDPSWLVFADWLYDGGEDALSAGVRAWLGSRYEPQPWGLGEYRTWDWWDPTTFYHASRGPEMVEPPLFVRLADYSREGDRTGDTFKEYPTRLDAVLALARVLGEGP